MKNLDGKRLALTALLLCAALLCAACGGNDQTAAATANEVAVVLNQTEYVLYQNIFGNDTGAQYVGQQVNKQGVFATIQDAYNGVTRYYVWGYLDNTRCCDWQWEIKPTDEKNLPANGSLVAVRGAFSASEDALDGYWITDAQIETITRYVGPTADVDMCTMSDTLERVQIYNTIYRSEAFVGKSFAAYGRVASSSALQDPYYDGSWQVPMAVGADIAVPAIGTTVVVRGTIGSGTLEVSSLTALN